LQYDFVQRPSSNRNLDIYAQDIDGGAITLSPYIELSKADKNDRLNGRATMYRTYTTGTSLDIETPQEYGRWKFVNWTNRYDDVVSTQAKANITITNDVVMKANYRYAGPKLFAPETVWVNGEGDEVNIAVTAQGTEYGDIDWNAQRNNEWITIVGTANRINNGSFTISVAANPSLQDERRGSIVIKPVYDGVDPVEIIVVQSKSSQQVTSAEIIDTPLARVYPNPTEGIVRLEFESSGAYTVTLADMSGRTLLRQTVTAQTAQIDVSAYPAGVYLLTINDGKRQSATRIVKN